jgi:tight adherence protein B
MSIVAVVFIAVVAIVFGAYAVFVVRPEGDEQRQLRKRLRGDAARRRAGAAIVKDEEHMSSVPLVDALLTRAADLVAPIQRLIDQSATKMTVGSFLFATGVAALAPVFVSMVLTGYPYAGLMIGTVLGFAPWLTLRYLRKRRMWKFEEQFPEGIDLISRALRAGHTFQTGLAMVAEEMQPPVGTEFRMIYDHQNFGMPMAEALKAFADRTSVLDAKFFVTAVLTQRDAGGNLAEVLDNLSSVIRERFKVKRQVRVISAHGRITGWILTGLPPTLAGVFAIVAPEHIRTLYEDPLGQKMIMLAICMQAVGSLIVKKIVNIEY